MASNEVALRSGEVLAAGATAERGLIELSRKGDPQAFARLVALHEGMVYNLAVRLLGDTEEARDASQDVFLQVYRHLGRFEGRSSLKTWIYRIVVNHCRNRRRFWRRRGAERACPLEDLTAADEARLAAARGSGHGPFESVARRERSRQLQLALLKLSFEHRAILLLKEVDGLSGEEIAMSLGIAEGTVKSRLARAREAIRRLLPPGLAEEVR